MSIIILVIVIMYVFYKMVDMGDGDDNIDDIDDFLALKDATSIARGDNPLDLDAQLKSITDPLELFRGK